MRTLLTGFGPFGKITDNPSGRVVSHFAQAGVPAHLSTRCLFVHLPPDPDTFAEPADGPTMPLEQQIEAILRILAHIAAGEQDALL
jgi:pyrrolidone-carboxylate peptidase